MTMVASAIFSVEPEAEQPHPLTPPELPNLRFPASIQLAEAQNLAGFQDLSVIFHR